MERLKNQFTDAVDQEMQRRIDAEQLERTLAQGFKRAKIEARRELVARSIAENRAQKHAEIQRYIDDRKSRERLMRPALRQLDSAGVVDMLEEINQGIWNNRGIVDTQDILDKKYRKYIIGKRYILSARIPMVRSTTTDIIKKDPVDEKIGTKTTYENDEDLHALIISFTSATNREMGILRVHDSSTKRQDDNSKSHLDTGFTLTPFNTDEAIDLLHNALVQSSIHRTDHSIEALYQQGIRDQEWLRKKGGTGYSVTVYPDSKQAPLSWRVKRQGQRIIDRLSVAAKA